MPTPSTEGLASPPERKSQEDVISFASLVEADVTREQLPTAKHGWRFDIDLDPAAASLFPQPRDRSEYYSGDACNS
jgi:hypothetical protein